MVFASIAGLGDGCNRDNEDKINNVIPNSFSGSSSSLHLVNDSVDFINFEILSRLPVKSLIRFKCVCKHWQFLIGKDSHFISLHQTRSKQCLLILVPKQINKSHIINPSYREFLITANLLFEGSSNNAVSVANVHTIREFDRMHFDILLGPINGLIGFLDLTLYNGICISNISTREITPWIKSTVANRLEGPEYYIWIDRDANCKMGFDPVTKEHKVICIWRIFNYYNRCEEIICEVLTVGDNKWRRIVETPPYWCSKASISVNGSVYYTTLAFMCGKIRVDNKLVVFDVGTEKFRAITIPNFILEHPRDNDRFIPSSYSYDVLHEGVHCELLEVDDHIALFSRINGYMVKLWLLDDNVDCNNYDTSNLNWTEVTIELPYFWGADRRLSLHSIVGTNQIILISSISYDKKYSHSLHSYNWRNKIIKEFEISGIPSVVPSFSLRDYATTFMESLLHVQKQTTTQQSAIWNWKQQTGTTTVKRKPVFVKIDQLKPGTYGHTLIAKVMTSNPVWAKAKRIAECLIDDETGSILFTARNEQVDIMKPGNTVIIRNAKIIMFKGSMRLAVDKWGRIEVTC